MLRAGDQSGRGTRAVLPPGRIGLADGVSNKQVPSGISHTYMVGGLWARGEGVVIFISSKTLQQY